MADDRVTQEDVQAVLASVPAVALGARARHGVVRLTGAVSSELERQQAAELAIAVDGVRVVENDIVVDPDQEAVQVPAGTQPSYDLQPAEMEDVLDQIVPLEEPEELLAARHEASDVLRDVEDAEPYFPPVDPVIEPAGRLEGGYKVLGGYADDSMDVPLSAEPPPARMEQNDLQIAENVELALKEDSATNDLEVNVHVRNGVVYLHGRVRYLQDVEAAEEVAGRVAGVREVREQLQLE